MPCFINSIETRRRLTSWCRALFATSISIADFSGGETVIMMHFIDEMNRIHTSLTTFSWAHLSHQVFYEYECLFARSGSFDAEGFIRSSVILHYLHLLYIFDQKCLEYSSPSFSSSRHHELPLFDCLMT